MRFSSFPIAIEETGPLHYITLMLDADGCLLPSPQLWGSYWEAVASLMNGWQNLNLSIEVQPFLSDYFTGNQEKCQLLESRLLKAMPAHMASLTAEFKRGNQVNQEKVKEIVWKILANHEISALVKPMVQKQREELIYRTALMILGSEYVIQTNLHLLNFFRRTIDNLKLEFPKNKFIIILAISSFRQSTRLDIRNYGKNCNGLVSMMLPFFYYYAFKKILSSELISIFFPLLLADYASKLKIGGSLFHRRDKSDDKDLVLNLSGSDKSFFIFQMLTLLSRVPYENRLPDKVSGYVFDDIKNDILNKIYNIAKYYPRVLSRQVTLSLVEYHNGEAEVRIFPPIQGQEDSEILQDLHSLVIYDLHKRKSRKERLLSVDDYFLLKFAMKKSEYISYPRLQKLVINPAEVDFKLDFSAKSYDSLGLYQLISASDSKFWDSAEAIIKSTDCLKSGLNLNLDKYNIKALLLAAKSATPENKSYGKILKFPNKFNLIHIAKALSDLGIVNLKQDDIFTSRYKFFMAIPKENWKKLINIIDKEGLVFYIEDYFKENNLDFYKEKIDELIYKVRNGDFSSDSFLDELIKYVIKIKLEPYNDKYSILVENILNILAKNRDFSIKILQMNQDRKLEDNENKSLMYRFSQDNQRLISEAIKDSTTVNKNIKKILSDCKADEAMEYLLDELLVIDYVEFRIQNNNKKLFATQDIEILFHDNASKCLFEINLYKKILEKIPLCLSSTYNYLFSWFSSMPDLNQQLKMLILDLNTSRQDFVKKYTQLHVKIKEVNSELLPDARKILEKLGMACQEYFPECHSLGASVSTSTSTFANI